MEHIQPQSLDCKTVERLARICGLFGSDHPGERATAAFQANKLLRDRGLSWHDVIIVPQQPTGAASASASDFRDQIRFALANLDLLSRWEHGFILGIFKRRLLSNRQLEVLEEIVARLRDAGGRP